MTERGFGVGVGLIDEFAVPYVGLTGAHFTNGTQTRPARRT